MQNRTNLYYIAALAAATSSMGAAAMSLAATNPQIQSSSVAAGVVANAETGAPTYKISGIVSGTAAAHVVVSLTGANLGSTVTDGGGSYSFSGLTSGTYVVSASLPGHTFSRSHRVTLGDVDSLSNDFTSVETPDTGIKIAAATLPEATVGVVYDVNAVASIDGGSGSYRYQTGPYVTGAPPRGLVLNNNGTVTGVPQVAGKYEFVVCANDAAGDTTGTCAPTTVTVAPATAAVNSVQAAALPAASAGLSTSWVYYNGVFDWPGDYSFVAKPYYTDTTGHPLSGPHDIKVEITGAWGGWLPYAKNWNFNSRGYTKLVFSLKPTIANQKWSVYFVKVGDVPVGIYLDVSKYGPAPVPGKWATYTVPLSALGVLGTNIYKFCIQDQTGSAGHSWFVDNVGFAP